MGKPFNDDWMRERGFLEEDSITAKSIIEQKNMRDFVSIDNKESIQTAIKLMKEYDISQIPVSENGQIIGSVNESDVLSKIIENPYNINNAIIDIIGKPFPTIDINTPVEKISTYITKKNTAVLVKDTIGQTHIITEYDLIRAIAK